MILKRTFYIHNQDLVELELRTTTIQGHSLLAEHESLVGVMFNSMIFELIERLKKDELAKRHNETT